ncbi:MAG: NAD(+)/NADH kinase [Patescibacteria group bacterium]|nr:NAD(+)/NADH kinase [Patescibacteria group bacterium]
MKMKIGIAFNQQTKPKTKQPAQKIAKWLKDNDCKIYFNPTKKILKNGLDFVIVLGGDGLILHLADQVADFAIPLIGINFGRSGYLCDVEYNKVFKKLEKILKENFKVRKATRIQAEIFRKDKKVKIISGLNEILIGGINRTVFLEIKTRDEKEEFKAEVIGDGIIISTQIGSTAYNLNAGGAMLLLDAFSVVASNGLFKSNFLLSNTKSFITSAKAIFETQILNLHKQNLLYLTADGQRSYKLESNDFIIIKKAKEKTLFVKL